MSGGSLQLREYPAETVRLYRARNAGGLGNIENGRVQQIITLEEMIGWHFYENVEDMREWLKRSHKEDNAKIPLIESLPPPA